MAVKEEVARERDFQCWRYGWGESGIFSAGDTSRERAGFSVLEIRVGRERDFQCWRYGWGERAGFSVLEIRVGRERDFQCWRDGWGERDMFNDGDTGG